MRNVLLTFPLFIMSLLCAQDKACIKNALHSSKPIQPLSLSFNILPREIKTVSGRTKVTLAAILQPLFGVAKAEIVASIKGHKKQFVYSSQLKKFIHDKALAIALFKSIEEYLAKQIKLSEANPSLLLINLKTYLDNGQAPTFTVTFQP